MRDSAGEPFTQAEAGLADRLRRWSDHGVVAIDAAEIATRTASAARLGRAGRARSWSWSGFGARRMMLWLAALLLAVGLALAAATLLRTSQEEAHRAVVVRQVEGGVDVVLAAADGGERVLRHLTPDMLGIDPRYTLGSANMGQAVSQEGWLQLRADGSGDDRTGLARWGLVILVDLADASSAPIALPANGFMSGRWGPDDRFALFCTDSTEPPNCGQPMGPGPHMEVGAVRVLDLDRGAASETIVPEVQTFGGGPDIFWTADGSGFLARRGTEWGVTPIDGGPFLPGAPGLFSRSQYSTIVGLDDLAAYWTADWRGAAFGSVTPLDTQRSADRATVWQLLDDPGGTSPRALLARLTGPDTVESVLAFDLPSRPGNAFTLAPDDTFVAIQLEGDDWERFVLAPVGAGAAPVIAGPVIHGVLAGLVPAATADAWPGL